MTERRDVSGEDPPTASGPAELRDEQAETEHRDEETAAEEVSTEDSPMGSGSADREGEQVEAEQRDAEPPSPLEPLLPPEEGNEFRSQWEVVQTGFVDEPRKAVEQAETLVASLTERLASSFSERRDQLEEQWDRGDEVSTEDLRLAMQRYRSFFDRLLRA